MRVPSLANLGVLAILCALASCTAPAPAPQPLSAPTHAVAVDAEPLLARRDLAADWEAPFPLDEQAAAEGSELYLSFCATCHGLGGQGDGPISKSLPAANLLTGLTCGRSDGFLYGAITAGGPLMPSMREGTTSRQRWQIVAHVRALHAQGCAQ